MNYDIIVGLLGFATAMIVVIKPIVTLSQNIATLSLSIEQLKECIEDLKGRVDHHGDEIDEISKTVTAHEARITVLERDNR